MTEAEEQSSGWGSHQTVDTAPNGSRIEALRLILSTEQKRDVNYEEAEEVGESLLTFYEALAGDADDG